MHGCTVYCEKVNICCYCLMNSTWTVGALLQNAWKQKKKKKKKKERNVKITNADATKAQSKRALGMAMGWVWVRFLYARTWPAGLNPLSEPAPFNKRVFFPTPNPPRRAPRAPRAPFCPTQPQIIIQIQTQLSKTQVLDLWISLSKSQTRTQILTQIQTQIS